jgi:hypothetical protein
MVPLVGPHKLPVFGNDTPHRLLWRHVLVNEPRDQGVLDASGKRRGGTSGPGQFF